MGQKTYDLIIVGGGPAGMTAGIYAARHKIKTLLITKNFGGQMARKAVNIENWPGVQEISGLDLIQKFLSHLKKQEVEILEDSISKAKKTGKLFSVLTGKRKNLGALAVLVASGADPRPLEVPGEKKFIGKGVAYCTACEAPLFQGKIVAVIGGGNAGFEAALSLSQHAKKVYLLEAGAKIQANEANIQKVAQTNKVEVIASAVLKKIQGQNFVQSIVYQDKSKKLQTLEVEGVFVEIGSIPATGFVKGLVDFNERDEIIVSPKTNMTRTSGLFAAGDVTDVKHKQIVIAAGEGAKAALSVYDYLQKL